jgi:hypothetical protein
MKQISLLLTALALWQGLSAQCVGNATFTCHRATELRNGVTTKEAPVEATIRFDGGTISITATMNGETEIIEGTIKETTLCDWSDDLQNGKARFRALTKKRGQNSFDSVIEIESINGATKISFGSDPDNGSRLQFIVAEYKKG